MTASAVDPAIASRLAALLEERDSLASALAARDQFLALVSHELRTPVQALLLDLHAILRLGPGRDDALEWTRARIEKSMISVRELAQMLDRFLDVTRIQAGRLDLSAEDTDLVEVVGDVVRRMRHELVWAGCDVSFEAPPRLPGSWDQLRLDAIVANLLSNARKYGAGKPIVVRLQKAERAAILTIEDHGPGIPAEHHDRIFHRFERVAAGSGPSVSGLGLGLWITRSFVEAHGGTIAVRNRPEGGAAFTVTLPAR